jgi:hypothetical protein
MRNGGTALLVAAAMLVVGCGGEEEISTNSAPRAGTTTEAGTTAEPSEPTGGDEAGNEGGGAGGVAADSPGDDPETALDAFFLSGDPDLVCGELATESLLSSAYGDEEGCRAAQVPGATPKSIEITALVVAGDEAEAKLIPAGGPNDGIKTTVALVNDGGWRVDSLEADIPAGP